MEACGQTVSQRREGTGPITFQKHAVSRSRWSAGARAPPKQSSIVDPPVYIDGRANQAVDLDVLASECGWEGRSLGERDGHVLFGNRIKQVFRAPTPEFLPELRLDPEGSPSKDRKRVREGSGPGFSLGRLIILSLNKGDRRTQQSST